MTLTSNGLNYDVFRTTELLENSISESTWTWITQAVVGTTLTLSNQPWPNAFYVLGKPCDCDGDNLTDAFEQLVSKTDPSAYSTRGDGIDDYTAYYQGRNLYVPGSVPDTNGIVNLQVFTPLRGTPNITSL